MMWIYIFVFSIILSFLIVKYLKNQYNFDYFVKKYNVTNIKNDTHIIFKYLIDIIKNTNNLSRHDKKIIIISFFMYCSNVNIFYLKLNYEEKKNIKNILQNLSLNNEKEQREALFINKLKEFINNETFDEKLKKIKMFDIEAKLQVKNILLIPNKKLQNLRDILSDAIKLYYIDTYITSYIDNSFKQYTYKWYCLLKKKLKINFQSDIQDLIDNNYIRTNQGKIIGLNKIKNLKEIIFNDSYLIKYLNQL